MYKMIPLLIVLFSGAEVPALMQESFEAMIPGVVDRQNQWVLESGSGEVQTQEVYGGGQALKLRYGTASRVLSSDESELWVRFHAFIPKAPENNPVITEELAGVGFFVNTNLSLSVFSNGVPVELAVPVATNGWIRFDLYCDYEGGIWNLSMDGTTVAAAVPIDPGNARADQVKIVNSDFDPVFVDDIEIVAEELTAQAPDFDHDGMPDWWEQKYFSSITAGDAAAMSGNPGWTYLQTYIAGISPITAEPFTLQQAGPYSFSWTAQPSRAYDVLWSTNLFTPFVPVATNLRESAEFTDMSSDTNLPAGYYKLQVRIDE